MPTATRIAALVNPINPSTEATVRDVQSAARVIGLQIQVFNVRTSGEINAAFVTFARERPDALFIGGDGPHQPAGANCHPDRAPCNSGDVFFT